MSAKKRKRRRIKRHTMSMRKRLWISQKYRCSICGRQIRQRKLFSPEINIDHIIPRARGGTSEIGNLAVTHQICNNAKRDACPCETYGPSYCTPAVHNYGMRESIEYLTPNVD